MKYLSSIFCLLLLTITSCNNGHSNKNDKVREFVKQWNDAHSQIQSPYLERNYMDVVTYYGNEYTKFDVQQDKNSLFKQFPEYSQLILNDNIEISKTGNTFLVKFTKRVKYSDKEADYTAFLSITTRNGDFKILREGVDKNNKDLDAPIFPIARELDTFMSNKRQLFGDFNGDGLSDYANVVLPEIISNADKDVKDENPVKCKDDCDSVIIFSNQDLGNITIKGSYKSQLENLKDLNNDGADEIGFWDIKPDSKTLYVYNAMNSSLICKPVVINTTVHKGLKLIDVFKKTGPKKITITFSEEINGKWILKSEEVILETASSRK